MLRPTTALRFRPVPVLQRLFDPPAPLPLDARESKQLLNLLTTSFREQLAYEHEAAFRLERRTVTEGSVKARQPDIGSPHRQRRTSDGTLARQKTDLHLQSVLTNPLFSKLPDEVSNPTAAKDPMVTFDQAVANGLMQLEYAKGCLVVKKRLITESASLSVWNSMGESGAGLKVLKWLVASGNANDMHFLRDADFRKVLLEFMVAENRQDIAWVWLAREVQQMHASPSGSALPFSSLLTALVRAESLASKTLDNAFICMQRAAALVKEMTWKQQTAFLGSTSRFLVQLILQMSHEQAMIKNYDAFELVSRFHKESSSYYRACLQLCHPRSPSATRAIAFFRSGGNRRVKDSKMPDAVWKVYRKKHIMLGIDAARHLLESGQDGDAKWLMARLQEEYPKDLDVAVPDKVLHPKSEKRQIEDDLNVHLLASLDLA